MADIDKLKITIDADECIGDGVCADICPEVFEMDDEEKAIVLVEEVPEDAVDDCNEAIESCPVTCIEIVK